MKRINFFVPEADLERLKERARDEGVSYATLIRRAIEALLRKKR